MKRRRRSHRRRRPTKRSGAKRKRSGAKKKDRRPHDPVYRRIFTNPGMVEEVLRRFVASPWIDKLDFSTLRPEPAHYVSRFLEPRESDVVWRVQYGSEEGEAFYVYVLMELQSSVKPLMALRLWAYVALFYQFLVKQGWLTPTGRLPPVLPVVLYNGERPWTAPRSLSALIEPLEGFEPPSFEYVVLDVGHYPAEELRPVEDVASAVFLLEQVANVAELEAIVDEVIRLIDDPELEEDISLLISSIAGKLALKGEKVPRLRTLKEIRNMLQERVAKWPEQWLEQGRKKGIQEGRKKGIQEGRKKGLREGKAEVLKALASQRFGELPPWASERFDRADVDTLDRWSRRILDARSLGDVLGEPE